MFCPTAATKLRRPRSPGGIENPFEKQLAHALAMNFSKWAAGGPGKLSSGGRMNADQAQEISERDQLWTSLHALRPEIEQLAAGAFDPAKEHEKLVALLARIVIAEMDFRDRSPSG